MRTVFFPVLIALVMQPLGLCPAAAFGSGDVVVVSLPFGDDLYVAGGKVVVTEPVSGDLLAAGGSMIFNGSVGSDLLAAGGSLIINSPVQDDVRVAGGDLVLTSTVGGDLIAYGGNVTIPAGAVVMGDAVVGSGSLYLAGTVRGNLLVYAGSLDFTGGVQGNAEFYGDEKVKIDGQVEGETVFAGRSVDLGPGARFGGDVSYWRQEGEIDFAGVPVDGQVRYLPELEQKKYGHGAIHAKEKVGKGLRAITGGFFLGTLVSGSVVIVLGILLLKGTFRRAGEELHRFAWRSIGVGFLAFLLLPLAGFIALITVVGLPIGLLLLAVFFLSVLFGRVIASMALAAWIERRSVSQWRTWRLILTAIGLFVLIKLTGLIPFVGWLVVLLTVCAGYGALVLGVWRSRPPA